MCVSMMIIAAGERRVSDRLMGGFTPQDIQRKIDSTRIGDKVRVIKWKEIEYNKYGNTTLEAIVLAKYPHFAVTTEGSFRWTEIMICERRQNEQRRGHRLFEGNPGDVI